MEITARVLEANDGLFHSIPAFESAGLEMRYFNRLPTNEEVLEYNENFSKYCEEHDKPALVSLLSSRSKPLLIYYVLRSFDHVVTYKQFEILKVLIDNGLDLGHQAFKGTLPRLVISLADNEEEFEKVLKMLIEAGMLIDDTENETYSTGLHIACLRLDVGAVRILLKYHANPSAINRLKVMPMNLVEKDECEESAEIRRLLHEAGGESKWNSYMD